MVSLLVYNRKLSFSNGINSRGKVNLKRVDEANDDFKKAIAVCPNYLQAIRNYSQNFALEIDLGFIEESSAQKRGTVLSKEQSDSHYGKSHCRSNAKQDKEAMQDFNKAVALDPNYASKIRGLAKKAIGSRPGNAEMYCKSGDRKFSLTQYVAAIRDYDKAIALNP